MTRGLLLDDTLYEYAPAERAARSALVTLIATETTLASADIADAWAAARDAVHARRGERGSSHSRLLYLSDLAPALRLPRALASARRWERACWSNISTCSTPSTRSRRARKSPGTSPPPTCSSWRSSDSPYFYWLAKEHGYTTRTFDAVFGERLHGESKWAFNWRSKARNVARSVTFMARLRAGLAYRTA